MRAGSGAGPQQLLPWGPPAPHAISFRRIRGPRIHACRWWHTSSCTRGAGGIRCRPWRTRSTSVRSPPGPVDASSPRRVHTAGTCIYTSSLSLAGCVGDLRVPTVPPEDGEVHLCLPPYRKGSIKRAMGPCVTGIRFYSVFGAGVRSKPSNARWAQRKWCENAKRPGIRLGPHNTPGRTAFSWLSPGFERRPRFPRDFSGRAAPPAPRGQDRAGEENGGGGEDHGGA